MVLSLLILTRLARGSSFDDCPTPTATPVPVGSCNDVDKLLADREIVLDPLANTLKEFFEDDVKPAPEHIGVQDGSTIATTTIYVTSTNGVRTGACTDKNSPCAIDYVFGKTGIGIQDYTIVIFDANPTVAYPKMRLILTKYVWLIGNGAVLTDSLQFEFTYDNNVLCQNQQVAVSVQSFTFCNYYVPAIHMQIDNMTAGEQSQFIVDIRCCKFILEHCRCIDIHLENKSDNCALLRECYTQFICIDVVYCDFLNCTRCGVECDTIGGFVIVDNRNDLVPCAASIQYCNFTNNCFYASDSNIGFMGGDCIAGLNLYAFSCCSCDFLNTTCGLPQGDIYGGAIFLYNEPTCSICKYTAIAYSNFTDQKLVHLDDTKCYGAGAAVYLHGQGVALVINDVFENNVITGVSTASGMDVAAYNSFDVIFCGDTFHQLMFKEENAATCKAFPYFIGGGSIYYDPYPCPPTGERVLNFAVLCCQFYGPEWLPLEVCPAEPDVCVNVTWIYGGAILVLNDLVNDYLNINVTNDNFFRVSADVGGAIMIAANNTNDNSDCSCLIDSVRTLVLIHTVYFESCTAELYGGSIVIAPANVYDENGCCGSRCRIFAVELIDIVNYLNWYPTSSVVISTARLGICKFLAYENEAGEGVFYLIQTEIKISGFLNISLTRNIYTSPTVPSIGGMFIAGKYSSLAFLNCSEVFINATGSQSVYHGWGIYIDPTCVDIPVQNFSCYGAITVNRVDPNGNDDMVNITINNESVDANPCSASGLSACSSTDSSIRCIHYCVCPYKGDPYCGVCQEPPSNTPTPEPPTAEPTPSQTPSCTPTKSCTPKATCTPTCTPTCTVSNQKSSSSTDVLDLDVTLMVNESFLTQKTDGSYTANENAYILVSTELTGGQLLFSSLVVSNVANITGASGEYSVEVPSDNLSIIYWSGSQSSFGIILSMFSWPESEKFTSLYLHITAKYELPSGMGVYEGLALSGSGIVSISQTGTTTSTGAGFALFGLNRWLLALALVIGTALMNL